MITGQLARELIELITDYNSWEDIRLEHPEYKYVKEMRDKAYELLLPYDGALVQTERGVGKLLINNDNGWRPLE